MQCGIPTRFHNKLKTKTPCTIALHSEPIQAEDFKIPTKPQTHTLVVCGTTNPGRGPIFSDFVTICHALMGRGVYGDFISCFPIEDHFDWLQREEPKDCGDGTTAVSATNVYGGRLTYTREDYDTCLKWWHQTGPFEIEAKIWQWIAVKARRAMPGDVINIVICGHGDPQRLGFYAGYHRVFPDALDQMLGKFKQGVRVNIISGVGHAVEEEEEEEEEEVDEAEEEDDCSVDHKGDHARTKRSRLLGGGFLGFDFSNIISRSLGLLRPCGIPQPSGDRFKA